MKLPPKIAARRRRKKSIQKKIRGTEARPRICVFRSAKHIYAQIIDDSTGSTLIAVSTISKDLKSKTKGMSSNLKGAKLVGETIGKKGIKKGIKKVVFDRNGFLFHGRVKALADAAREHGLEF